RMFVVLDGQVGVITSSQQAQATHSHETISSIVLGPGEMVGELTMALRRPRTATVQAIGSTALLSLAYKHVENSLNSRQREHLDALLAARPLEHVCRHVSYLGLDEGRPYTAVAEPWHALADDAQLVPLTTRPDERIDETHEALNRDGITILVTGSVREA